MGFILWSGMKKDQEPTLKMGPRKKRLCEPNSPRDKKKPCKPNSLRDKVGSSSSVVEMGETLQNYNPPVEMKEKVSYSSSWVVEMEEMLQNYNPSAETERWKQHSIHRVPEIIKEETDKSAYSPQLVSIGPLHRGEDPLQPMEKHKRRAVLHMVRRSGKPLGEYLAAIEKVADQLEAAYPDLDDKWRGVDKRWSFMEMMVTDGCFLLELMRKSLILRGEHIVDDYGASDPVFSHQGFLSLWPYLRNDMIRMENQQPLLVLQRLDAVHSGTSPSAARINNMVLLLVDCPRNRNMNELGLHILDIFHKSYCDACLRSEVPPGGRILEARVH